MLFSVHLEIMPILSQDRRMVCANIPLPQKSIWTHPMVLLGDEAQVEAHFGPFGGSANFDAR
jgi:hypothetical protein